ncbi:MAG: endolytic transglycosylase MltG [Candidatus Sungbacteria bacterium]|nr:endolytic transglycosylase MltG [bacterium]MDZ4260482.1 endolytic transglycosylase MltG [Candidatus Sungbacteria bacterium]
MNTDFPIPFSRQPRTRPWKFYLYIASVLFLLLTVALSINGIYRPHPLFAGTRSIEIPQGLGSRMIGDKLKKEGFIQSKWMFVIYVSLRGTASSLKPGTYDFENASITTIAQALVKGTTREKTITLPEGATVNDLAEILQQQGVVGGASFAVFAMAHTFPELSSAYPFLKNAVKTSGLEGYLFPDTYHLFKEASPEEIANVFLRNFDAKLTPEIRENIKQSGKTLHEIIIMASLIEKEVVSDEDRQTVSGILWKRLQLEIPLQVDATIVYAKKRNNLITPANGRLLLSDLAIDSPYNTYTHRGLPIGPIGNPGTSAINAALHPASSSYLYYLSASDGKTIFSKTFEEHVMAKQKYLR